MQWTRTLYSCPCSESTEEKYSFAVKQLAHEYHDLQSGLHHLPLPQVVRTQFESKYLIS